MYCCQKNKKNKLSIGGIDNILAYIVVSIPLMYILVFMIGTLYHYAIQSYITQAVKETVTNASSYGNLTSDMLDDLNDKLTRVTDSAIHYKLVRLRYKDTASPEYKRDPVTVTEEDIGTVKTRVSVPDAEGKDYFRKGDIIGLQVRSANESMMSSISKFSLFGRAGSTDMYYTAYREDIIRNTGDDEV